MDPKVKISDIENKLEEWRFGAYESEIRNGGTPEEAAEMAYKLENWARQKGVYDVETRTISVPYDSERE